MLIKVTDKGLFDQFNQLDPQKESFYIVKRYAHDKIFRFHTRDEIQNERGKRAHFHRDLNFAREYDSFEFAAAKAKYFVATEHEPKGVFFICDFQKATILFYKTHQRLENNKLLHKQMVQDFLDKNKEL